MMGLLAKFRGNRAPTEVLEIVQIDSPAIGGAAAACAYFSGRIGGDFHGFVRVSPTRFLFGLLDVAGKAENNKAIRHAAQSCFRAAGEELLSAKELNEADAMIELARRLNLEIMHAAGGVCSCPAFAGCYNEELGTLCYVNAGHTPGLLRDVSATLELQATGLPLGLFSLAPTDAHIIALGSKASLAVVSRGVIEAECQGHEFGLAGVRQAIETDNGSARDLSRRILTQVQDFMCRLPKHNDVTALALTRGSSPS